MNCFCHRFHENSPWSDRLDGERVWWCVSPGQCLEISLTIRFVIQFSSHLFNVGIRGKAIMVRRFSYVSFSYRHYFSRFSLLLWFDKPMITRLLGCWLFFVISNMWNGILLALDLLAKGVEIPLHVFIVGRIISAHNLKVMPKLYCFLHHI